MKPQITILPIGSWEYHGPHLPMSTDTDIAVGIAKQIASALSAQPEFTRGLSVELLPAVTLSCSHEHERAVSLSAKTLLTVLDDIAAQVEGPLLLINAHGGNHAIENWVLEQNRRQRRVLWFPRDWNWRLACERAGTSTSWGEDVHAGEVETSLMLALAPERVRLDLRPADHLCNNRRLWPVFGMSAFTQDGVIGRPSKAEKSTGVALLDALASLALEEVAIIGADWRADYECV